MKAMANDNKQGKKTNEIKKLRKQIFSTLRLLLCPSRVRSKKRHKTIVAVFAFLRVFFYWYY
jgi:hypothetical protein